MANAQRHVGQPEPQIGDQATLTGRVIGPVQLGGWYECDDGSRAHFEWIGGRLTLLAVEPPAPLFAAVASDGGRFVVWGIGPTEEAAACDARAQDFGGDEFRPDEFTTIAITAEHAVQIRAGVVSCEELGIEMKS
jgi:hypothetical protein